MNLKKLIKGVICITLFVGLFSLNVVPLDKPVSSNENRIISQSTIAHYAGNSVLAQERDYGSSPGGTPGDPPPEALEASAAESRAAAAKTDQPVDINAILAGVSKASTLVNYVFNPMINFLTTYIGVFMSNDYIFAGDMGNMLHTIWVISRNICNIVFVLVLLFMAVRQIFSEKEEGTSLAKKLPTFALMLIAINFSWLAGRVILDAANVATNVVFAIPSGIQTDLKIIPCAVNTESAGGVKGSCMVNGQWVAPDGTDVVDYTDTQCTPENIKKIVDARKAAYPEGSTTGTGDGKVAGMNDNSGAALSVIKKNIFCWKTIDVNAYNRSSASYFLTYSMAKVQNLTRSTTGSDIFKVAIGIIFSMILQVIYLTAFAALTIVLIIRVLMLWLMMAFSPFIVLMMYLGMEGGPGIKAPTEVENYLSFKQFSKWAFAPVKVGAVWAVGFIMIITGQSMSNDLFAKLNDANAKITSEIVGFKTLFYGMNSMQELMWLIMTVALIWGGTFAMFKDMGIATVITDKIKGYGKSLVTGTGALAAAAPIFPMGEGRKASVESALALPKSALAEKLSKYREATGYKEGDIDTKIDAAKEKLKTKEKIDITVSMTGDDIIKKINEITNQNFSKQVIKDNWDKWSKLIDELKIENKDKIKGIVKETVDKQLPGTV